MIEYSTDYGGTFDQTAAAVAVDASGNTYVTGWTNGTIPIPGSAFQTVLKPVSDAFVAKYDATGALVYSTYLGGGASSQVNGLDQGEGIAVDSAGNVYIGGSAQSIDFPVTSHAYDTACGSQPCSFIAKLKTSGTALIYSTLLESSTVFAIALDAAGSAYVTGWARTGFPVTGVIGDSCSDSAFVTKLNPAGSALVYSRCIGGRGLDIGKGIALDSDGNPWITGSTTSADFPLVNPAQSSFGGLEDAFVVKLGAPKLLGVPLAFSTYLGGSRYEIGNAIAIDSAGFVYITGLTTSSNFPAFPPVTQLQGSEDAFVAKYSAAGAVQFARFLGGSGEDEGRGIAVLGGGSHTTAKVYVTGVTKSINFPALNPVDTCSGNNDAFVWKLGDSTSPSWSTCLSGSGTDGGNAIAVSSLAGATFVHVVGLTYSTNFPAVHAAQPVKVGNSDAFVLKIRD